MDKAVWLAKRNYWIAGIGAVISVVSFFFFPFLTFHASFLGIIQAEPSVNAVYLALYQGLLWVSLLLVLAVLGVVLFFLLRRNPFGSRVPLQVQARWTACGLIVAGVLSAVCLVESLPLVPQNAQDIVSVLKIVGDFSVTWAFGAYLFLAGLAVIVIAGIMELIWPVAMSSDGGMAALPNYPQNQYSYPPESYRSTPRPPNQSPPPPYGQ